MSFPHIEKTITFDDETGILTEEIKGGYRAVNNETDRMKECISELYMLLDDITERAMLHDLSLLRASGRPGGCDVYQGLPLIVRARDNILMKYDDLIHQSLKHTEVI